VAHADDGVLALRAQPEMAVVHQEFDAVVLGRDGIGIGFGNLLQDLDGFDIHLVAAGARASARTLPRTMSDDSCVRCFRLSKTLRAARS
jgi:hypothetical protein